MAARATSPWAPLRRRSEALRARHPFATEVLTLYVALLDVWEEAGDAALRVVAQLTGAKIDIQLGEAPRESVVQRAGLTADAAAVQAGGTLGGLYRA